MALPFLDYFPQLGADGAAAAGLPALGGTCTRKGATRSGQRALRKPRVRIMNSSTAAPPQATGSSDGSGGGPALSSALISPTPSTPFRLWSRRSQRSAPLPAKHGKTRSGGASERGRVEAERPFRRRRRLVRVELGAWRQPRADLDRLAGRLALAGALLDDVVEELPDAQDVVVDARAVARASPDTESSTFDSSPL